MNEFRRLLRYAAPYRGRLVIAVLAMVVYAAGSVGLAKLIQPIYDDVLSLQQNVLRTSILILVAYFVKGIGSYVSGYVMTDVGQRVVRDLRNGLFGHILRQSAAFFSRRSSGQLISRITNDVAQIQQAVSETLADLVRESITVVGYAVFLFVTDWHLALVCMTAAPLVVVS